MSEVAEDARHAVDASAASDAANLGQAPFWNLSSLVALLMVLAPLTIGAIGAFPIFDDAWNWLYLKEKGTDFITSLPDRPLMGYVWTVLSLSEDAFWLFNYAAHAFLWGGLAFATAILWRHLLPNLAPYGWVAACVAIAPFGFQLHTMLANIVLGCLLSIVLAYSAYLLLLRFIRASDAAGWTSLMASQLLLGFAILYMEYAFSVVGIMTSLLLLPAILNPNEGERSRTYRVILLSIVVAGVAYGAYYLLAEWRANTGIMYKHPPNAKELGVMFVVKMVQSIWQGVIGNLALSLSEVRLTSKSGLLAVLYGAVVGILLIAGTRAHRASNISTQSMGGSIVLLAIAMVAGLLPVIYSGRLPWNPDDGGTARFGTALLPVMAMVLLLTGLSLVRRKLWFILVFLLGGAAGDIAFSEGWRVIQDRQEMAAMGAAVRPHVSDRGGLTVAVVSMPWRKFGPARQWELAARLSADWPVAQREKFWAFRYGGNPPLTFYSEEASLLFGTRGECRIPKQGDFGGRLVERKGPIDRFLWIERRPDGTIAVEPFCLKDAGVNKPA